MRAVILVGGFGTRLRPLTYTTPKQMLPIAGIPQLERKIAHLVTHGVDDIVLSMGYKPDAFTDVYPDNVCAGADLHYVVEDEPLGTAGAIAFAARQAGISETFLAMNGDVLTDLNVRSLVGMHREKGAEGTLALTPVEDPSRFGVVVTDESSRVLAFIEKPSAAQTEVLVPQLSKDAQTNLINAGTYVLEPSFLDRVPGGISVSIERETFPTMVAEGSLYAGSFDHYWLDIGTPEAYLQGNLDLLDQRNNGRSFVAPNARVDSSATVKRSVLCDGVVVGAGATVTESVLLAGATVEVGATIDRSIVADHTIVGAGANLSNLTVVGAHLSVPPNAALNGEKVSPPGHP